MTKTDIALIGVRSAALALSLSGNQKIADGLYTFADAYEAGQATEEHMKAVGEKLKSRSINEEDWVDLFRRIQRDRDALHKPV